MLKSFRLHLTVWSVLFLSLLLVAFSGFLYLLLGRDLSSRVDASLATKTAIASNMLADELDEASGDANTAAREVVRLASPASYLAVFENGRRLAASRELQKTEVPLTPGMLDVHGARVVTKAQVWHGRHFTIAIVEPLDTVSNQLADFRHVAYIALPVAILIAALGGFVLATKSIAPIVIISEQAEAITDKNLHTRLSAPGARLEFARLAAVFNELLSRLDRSFERMRDFMADASHELRTPLSIIRGEADVALAQNRQPAEYRESLAIIQDEARRLTSLVEDLFNLARADAGHQKLQVEEVYLNDLLEECCRSAQAQARQKGVQLATPPCPDVGFRGDPALLRRAISNLLDNAIRYTPADGRVEAALAADAAHARVTIADTGAGIRAESLDLIFERFYRVDKARSRVDGGFGLGLAIVKWIVDAHAGQVSVVSEPGKGSTFTVELPLTANAQARRVAPAATGRLS